VNLTGTWQSTAHLFSLQDYYSNALQSFSTREGNLLTRAFDSVPYCRLMVFWANIIFAIVTSCDQTCCQPVKFFQQASSSSIFYIHSWEHWTWGETIFATSNQVVLTKFQLSKLVIITGRKCAGMLKLYLLIMLAYIDKIEC